MVFCFGASARLNPTPKSMSRISRRVGRTVWPCSSVYLTSGHFAHIKMCHHSPTSSRVDRLGSTEQGGQADEYRVGIQSRRTIAWHSRAHTPQIKVSSDEQRLLEVKDLCDVEVPDERSVMTYVAEFFHKFSSEGSWQLTHGSLVDTLDKAETGARRVEKFAELMQGIWLNKNDFERRMTILLDAIHSTQSTWQKAPQASAYPEAISHLAAFADYKKTSKRSWVKERQELAALYSNIQTKLRTYALRAWEPREGLRLEVGRAD